MSDAELVKEILQSKPIAYRADFAKIAGSVTAGVMLSQAYYWTGKSTKHGDGWFEKTGADWNDETGLTDKQQQTARFILEKKGLMHSERKGDRGRMCSRVNHTAVYDALFEYFKAADRQKGDSTKGQIGKREKLHRQKGDSKIGKKADLSLQRLLTENTTENRGTKIAALPAASIYPKVVEIFSKGYESLTGAKLSFHGNGAKYGNQIKTIIKQASETTNSSDDGVLLGIIRARAMMLFREIEMERRQGKSFWVKKGFLPATLMNSWNQWATVGESEKPIESGLRSMTAEEFEAHQALKHG